MSRNKRDFIKGIFGFYTICEMGFKVVGNVLGIIIYAIDLLICLYYLQKVYGNVFEWALGNKCFVNILIQLR